MYLFSIIVVGSFFCSDGDNIQACSQGTVGHDWRNPPLDLVYLFCHSSASDQELLYSLRSVAKSLPFVRKIWIFGDRPHYLTGDTAVIEHVSHDYVAPLLQFGTPVRNDFLMVVLASLLPRVSFEFVRFSDDYIILEPLTREKLCIPRALEDLSKQANRAKGKWVEMLWRTFDILKQFGYAGYNFEAHVPQPLTKELVFEAFMAFRGFVHEDRFQGMQGATTIYNYALKHHGLKFVWLADEQSRAGFYGKCPSEAEIEAACLGKLFLNFDGPGFGPPMIEFLQKRFPHPCKYERPES